MRCGRSGSISDRSIACAAMGRMGLELVIAGPCDRNADREGSSNFCGAFLEFPATFWNFRYLGMPFLRERMRVRWRWRQGEGMARCSAADRAVRAPIGVARVVVFMAQCSLCCSRLKKRRPLFGDAREITPHAVRAHYGCARFFRG
jgi:hypothetical protein